MYGVVIILTTTGLRKQHQKRTVLLSRIFSGPGILQFSVYVVFCNKGVI